MIKYNKTKHNLKQLINDVDNEICIERVNGILRECPLVDDDWITCNRIDSNLKRQGKSHRCWDIIGAWGEGNYGNL